jgi:hypothetical protein
LSGINLLDHFDQPCKGRKIAFETVEEIPTSQDSGSAKKRLQSVQCDVGGRIFQAELLLLSNGCFASISEDKSPRMGAITVAVKTGGRSTSSSIIPESKGAIFAGMVSEMLAEKLKGIAVVSLYLREELDSASMKTLINEVRKLLN